MTGRGGRMSQGTLTTIGGKREKLVVEWDTDKPETVEAAQQTFIQLVEQEKYTPVRVEGDSRETMTGEAAHSFDPDVQAYEMLSQQAGG